MKNKFFILMMLVSKLVYATSSFVSLPADSNANSAYVACNTSGDYGRSQADLPQAQVQSHCAVINDVLSKNSLASPEDGFRLIGVQASDVEMDAAHSGKDSVVARFSEAIWRNQSNTECILATHFEMYDAPLANGQYFKVNDILRAGFAKRNVAVAYFHKAHSDQIGGNAEVLFRAGRTFTSTKTKSGQQELPTTSNAPSANVPFSFNNTAKVSDNWVDFTTDISFKDSDSSTRAISSMLYIKYDCDARDPINKPNAIRLRSIGKNAQESFEISFPGLIPVDAEVELF